jgi:hypothetical protein
MPGLTPQYKKTFRVCIWELEVSPRKSTDLEGIII